MESISNMAAAAAKAVWGEDTKEEPLSGVTGNTAKGEPYDAGNMGEVPGLTRILSPPSTGLPLH